MKKLVAVVLLGLLSAFIGSANSSTALEAKSKHADSIIEEETSNFPEPSTFVLFAIGLVGLGMARSQIRENRD